MSEFKIPRLIAAAKEFNVGQDKLIDFLLERGYPKEDLKPTSKLTGEMYQAIQKEFQSDKVTKMKSDRVFLPKGAQAEVKKIAPGNLNKETPRIKDKKEENLSKEGLSQIDVKKAGKNINESAIDSSQKSQQIIDNNIQDETKEETSSHNKPEEIENIDVSKLTGPKILGRIELPIDGEAKISGEPKRKRKRISIEKDSPTKINSKEIDLYRVGKETSVLIKQKINPSLVLFEMDMEYQGVLLLQDISKSLLVAQKIFNQLKIGQSVNCKIQRVVEEKRIIYLTIRHLYPLTSEGIGWERINRGDEIEGTITEEFFLSFLITTSKGFYGILDKIHTNNTIRDSLKLRVHSKNEKNDLLVLLPACLEIDTISESDVILGEKFQFIEEDLRSFSAFKKSMLSDRATDEQLDFLKKAYEEYPDIFSKEASTPFTLFPVFERRSSVYESIFKGNIIPYLLTNFKSATKNPEENALRILSTTSYWMRINEREVDGKPQSEFTLFNEEFSIYGIVRKSRNPKEYQFQIHNIAIGNQYTRLKRRDSKLGSFLFSSIIHILSPYKSLPIDDSQKRLYDYLTTKSKCFEIIRKLKLETGEILRTEGTTLAINDRFLEYQINLIDKTPASNVFVPEFHQIPSSGQGISIKIKKKYAASLEIEEDNMVTLGMKGSSASADEDLIPFTKGKMFLKEDSAELYISREVNLQPLADGFYLSKDTSTYQFDVQREIIQDFLQKKIKIEHIEALLVNPEKVKTPISANLNFVNTQLTESEKRNPNNNQIKAVKNAVGNQNIYLIQGPPGTGKTTVIAEIIEQLVGRGERILVASQNHVAVDNVLEKMKNKHGLTLLRIGNKEKIGLGLVSFSIDNLLDDYKADFTTFIFNQLLLAREYVELTQRNETQEAIIVQFNIRVNELVAGYRRLKGIYKEKHFILREGLTQLSIDELPPIIATLENWSDSVQKEYDAILKPIIYNSVDVVFGTCIGIKMDQVFKKSNIKFDTVIIDEAGKANIAETLVAIELGKKVILVGDQLQLPPYLDSTLIDEREQGSFINSVYGSEYLLDDIKHALKTSFFEFLINRISTGRFPRENMVMLNYQHRMHPSIGEFVSQCFYDGKVLMGENTHLNHLELPAPFDKEVVFFDTSNLQNPYEQSDDYSAKNNTEAHSISELILPKLFEAGIGNDKIAIIAPYKSQVAAIQTYIISSELQTYSNIEVSTLDSFQGREYDIIIFSFTRSINHDIVAKGGGNKFQKVGFLDDARRLNVAFSRAKKKLILVGNSKTLTDYRSHYDGLFNYTMLFRNLVELSKNPEIGSFVNIATYSNFGEARKVNYGNPEHLVIRNAQYDEFCKKNVHNKIVDGKIKAVYDEMQLAPGIFLTVDNFECFIPINQIPLPFRKLETFKVGEGLSAQIIFFNNERKQVTLSLYNVINWNESNKIRLRDQWYNAIFVKEVKYGLVVELQDFHLRAFISNSKLNWQTKQNEYKTGETRIQLKVGHIDYTKRQITGFQ